MESKPDPNNIEFLINKALKETAGLMTGSFLEIIISNLEEGLIVYVKKQNENDGWK